MTSPAGPAAGDLDATVVRADAADLDVLGLVIADAFHDLAPSRWLIDDPAARRELAAHRATLGAEETGEARWRQDQFDGARRAMQRRRCLQRDRQFVFATAEALIDAGLSLIENEPDAVLSEEIYAAVARHAPRDGLTTSGPLPVRVDRQRARFGSWYELFPRSWGGLRGIERFRPLAPETVRQDRRSRLEGRRYESRFQI